jgi:hypothetical protein
MNYCSNGSKTQKRGFGTIRAFFLKKCQVFDVTPTRSNIEHLIIFSYCGWSLPV